MKEATLDPSGGVGILEGSQGQLSGPWNINRPYHVLHSQSGHGHSPLIEIRVTKYSGVLGPVWHVRRRIVRYAVRANFIALHTSVLREVFSDGFIDFQGGVLLPSPSARTGKGGR